jgi:F-type H+-transporting ATPase subunit c
MQEVTKSAQEITIILAGLKPFMMAIGGLMPALAIGKIGAAAMQAIGRNPESSSKLFIPMILGMALAESIAIYTLIIVLMN